MTNLKIVHTGVPADNFQLPQQSFAANGAILPIGGIVYLNTAAALTLTLSNMQAGQVYFIYKLGTNTAVLTLDKDMPDANNILTFAATTAQSVVLVIGLNGVPMPVAASAGVTYS